MPPPASDDPKAIAAREYVVRIDLLQNWLDRRLSPDARAWLGEQIQQIRDNAGCPAFIAAFDLVPRQLGRMPLDLNESERNAGQDVVPGLDTIGWGIDLAARILLALASFDGDEGAFTERLETVAQFGETGVQIALLRGLPVFPAPDRLLSLAGEGLRSAVQPVFEAVAHNSPYPARHFSEPIWNKMVMKALFVGSRLAPIQGLDERRNAELARMLVDYAHECWAALRPVSPELWRCVGPFAGEAYFADLLKVFRSGGGDERKAAALALAECPMPEALIAIETAPTLWRDIRSGRLTWEQIGWPRSAPRCVC